MGFELVWDDADIENAANDFDDAVAEALERALSSKKTEIQWKTTLSGLSKRIHNMFGVGELQIAEIAFSVNAAEYRALCIVVHEKPALVYYTTVPKAGSLQKRKIATIRDNSPEIQEFIRRKAAQSSS